MSDARWDRFQRETWLALRQRDRQRLTSWGRWWHGHRMRQVRADAWAVATGIVGALLAVSAAWLLWLVFALIVAPLGR